MDLLFKNPTYFFQTYFAFSLPEFLITFALVLAVHILLCRKRFSHWLPRLAFILVSSFYFTILIGITLLNSNRSDRYELALNPLNNISNLFNDSTRIHELRAVKSNTVFFVPCGILSAVYFKRRKLLYSVLFGAALSVTIEVFQFALHRGCAETMDVICNTLGAVIGALITVLILLIINKLHNKRGS